MKRSPRHSQVLSAAVAGVFIWLSAAGGCADAGGAAPRRAGLASIAEIGAGVLACFAGGYGSVTSQPQRAMDTSYRPGPVPSDFSR